MNINAANSHKVFSKKANYSHFNRRYERATFQEKVSMSTWTVQKYSSNNSSSRGYLWPLVLCWVTTLDQSQSSSKISSCQNDDEDNNIQQVMENLWNDVKNGNLQSISMDDVIKPVATSVGLDVRVKHDRSKE